MVIEDFLFGDKKLSDFGGMIGYIETSSSRSVQFGTGLVINSFMNNVTYKTQVQNVKYEEVLTCNFDIVKSNCKNNDLYFTDNQATAIMKWLKSTKFKKFLPIYDDSSFHDVYFNGTFNDVSAIIINDKIIGFTVTFTNDSPFGYIDIDIEELGINMFVVYDNSDEYKTYHPIIHFECLEDGDLTISNSLQNDEVSIKNCAAGEIITFDVEKKIITSSVEHSKLYNDFNYAYPLIVNNEDNSTNIFTTSLNCNVTGKYQSYKKVGICV